MYPMRTPAENQRNNTIMLDPDKIYLELEEAAEARAQAEYDAYLLEKHGEILMANLMVSAKDQGAPIGLCKEVARTDPQWEVHVKGEAAAMHKRSRARAKYENLRALFEARRSVEASTRQITR